MNRPFMGSGSLRKRIVGFAVPAVLWICLSSWVGWYAVGPGYPDGFQSVGASFGGSPGHLNWPMMGDFEGFDLAWGYHWVGWPMIRSLLSVVLPWTALGDGIALHVLRALLAVLVAETVFRQTRSTPASFVALFTVLLNRGWFCSMAFLFRPETLSALVLWGAAFPLISKFHRGGWILTTISVLCLMLLPLLHPLAWPAALIVVVFGTVSMRSSAANENWMLASLVRWWLPLMTGVALFAGYYLMDPLRGQQFMQTIETTALFKSGMLVTAKRLFFDPKNLFFSAPAAVVLITGLFALRGATGHGKSWSGGMGLSLALILASFVYLFLAGHPNTGHAAVMAPFVGHAAGRLYAMEWRWRPLNFLIRPGFIGLALVCSLPLVLVAGAFFQCVPQSPRSMARMVLSRALAESSGQVIIPLALWEAAGELPAEKRSRLSFATFPNWVTVDRRLRYETGVIRGLKDGDVLVVDGTPPEPSDPANILPWPRTDLLRAAGETPWAEVEHYSAIVNSTLLLGSLRRDEMQLGPMQLFRYQSNQ
jgi:hypothetical protein